MPSADEVFASVIGTRSGYVRGRGHGPLPASSRARTMYTAASVAYARNLQAQMTSMQAKHKNAMEEFRAENDARLKASEEQRIQSEARIKSMEEMLSRLAQNQ